MEEKLHKQFKVWDELVTFSRYLVVFMMGFWLSSFDWIVFGVLVFVMLLNGALYYQLKVHLEKIVAEKRRNGTLID